MTQRTTIGFIAVFTCVLLATMTLVSADHAATGKGTYAITPQVLAEFHFVVAKQGINLDLEPSHNFVRSEMVGIDDPTSFRMSITSTAIAPLDITTEPAGRTVTIKGELVATTFLGVEPGLQIFAELAPFTATGVDKRTSTPGADFFSLVVEFSTSQDQGPLFASWGFGVCDDKTKICTITFQGPVKTGNIFVHTAGSD
jgi:hypothetical protein